MSFLHGIEVIELDVGTRPIETPKSSVIGLVGTAKKGPVNTPTLIAGSRKEAVKIFGAPDGKSTIPDALDSIFDQIGAAVVVINVLEKGKAPDSVVSSQVSGRVNPQTGQYEGALALLAAESVVHLTPRLLIAPGYTKEKTVVDSLIAIAERLRAVIIADGPNTTDAEAKTYRNKFDSPRVYLVDPSVKTIFTERTYKLTEQSFTSLKAKSVTDANIKKLKPLDGKVYKSEAELLIDIKKAITDEAVASLALKSAVSSAKDKTVNQPASGRVAGIIAKSDYQRGFWYSPSNRPVLGIAGTTRPIDFTMGDSNARANLLNENNVATIIHQDGYRLWGNRTCTSDKKWMFLSVRRTADLINDALLRSHLWAVDNNVTKSYLDNVVRGVNNYLRYLKSIGALIGGECWADPELNTPDQIQLGRVKFDFDFTPPYPAEHITFRSQLVNNYLEEVL